MALVPVFVFSLFLHLFVGWQLLGDLVTVSPNAAIATGALLVCSSVLIPVSMIGIRKRHSSLWDQGLQWIGLLCMGWFSSMLVFTLVRAGVLLLLHMAQLALFPSLKLAALQASSGLAVLVFAVGVSALGFWNARRTATVVKMDVPVPDLPAALHGFLVAQISDVHVGPTIKRPYLERIVDKVNLLGAHMVAITGDLVDGSVHELAEHIYPLARLQSTHGSFFVTGNHEYYSGANAWIEVIRALGVRVLMNEHHVVHHTNLASRHTAVPIVIAGVSDFTAHHFDEKHRSDAHKAMAGAPENAAYKLLLAHQPRSAAQAALAGFDLQLSGHTHGGQFWPWNHFVRLQQPFTAGLHKLQNMWIYTSRGTGYWGPPKRFWAPSEITLLRLVAASESMP
ncbi:metallophosphoesterase [Rhodoferax aquaticus]|uniref:Metallophosphoesterase n=1 Tax=Rhodoferax aquaticus TaxID=2527691 RepID=A0A515EJ56_9BURK|nr:metallophosphoesterase [Rhodoferax aquaticus]QDL52690.1 metallophosphoesterase [Rhodoferax aquaticus]